MVTASNLIRRFFMKDSKFWVWFIPLFIIVAIGLYLSISLTDNSLTAEVKTDSAKIKEEYENLNGSEALIDVSLSENNVYQYATNDNIKDLLDNKRGILFIGLNNDNVSRNNIMILNDVIMSTNINDVYYYDINNIDDDINAYLINKLNISNIKNGLVIVYKDGDILNIIDSKDLNNDELSKIYHDAVAELIEQCDESC